MANNGIVYGLLKQKGIDGTGLTPKEAWEKLNEVEGKQNSQSKQESAEEKKVNAIVKGKEEKTIGDYRKEAVDNNNIKTISQEEKERLKKGVESGSISIEEVQKLPLVQNAEKEAKVPDEKQTVNIDTPERKKLREEVANKLLNMGSYTGKKDGKDSFDGEVKQERIAHIVIGAPAGGKSSVMANPLSKQFSARIIDSDDAKKGLPEYNGGLGAGIVHEESSRIAKNMVFPSAVKNGDNIILPIVGKSKDSIEGYRKQLKDAGYKVYLNLNEVGSETSKKRAFTRFLDTGRFLSFDYLDSIGDLPLKNYQDYKKTGGFDGYAHFNNEVKRGEKPKRIEQTYDLDF